MKILIADDEKMARLSLQSMLEELYPDEHQYEFAADGADMLNKLDSFMPSIVVLDINMPRLNGLDALDQCRQDYPDTVFIIISGYSDFEYARRGISLGVTDYLLKPVDIEDLKQTIERAKDQMAARDSLRQNAFDGAVYGYLANETEYEDNASLFNNPVNPYKLFYICRDGSGSVDVSRELLRCVTRFCAKTADSDDLYSCHYLPNGKLCLVLSSGRRITYRRFFADLCSSSKFGAVTVFCDEDLSMRNIKKKADNLENLCSVRCIGLAEALTDCGSIPEAASDPNVLGFARNMEEFVTSFTYSTSETESILNSLRSNDSCRDVFGRLPKQPLNAYLKRVTGTSFDTADYDRFIQSLFELVHSIRKSEYDDSTDIIKRAKKYVSENYRKGISISDVAEALSLSPAYLSRLFHSKTGEKYIDYLTRVRMEAAEQLFRDQPGISVKKVAEEVGYFSTRHFKEMYSRYTGRK